jgi:hypothetical protein
VLTNPRNLVSFSVLFGICNNLGGLIGAALLGTFQIVREKFHSSHIVEHLTLSIRWWPRACRAAARPMAALLADPSLRNLAGFAAWPTRPLARPTCWPITMCSC